MRFHDYHLLQRLDILFRDSRCLCQGIHRLLLLPQQAQNHGAFGDGRVDTRIHRMREPFYICNPNNPTGTLTPRKDLEYILANKPKDAVLIVDEAYVHFAGLENMSTDLVRADKDVVVLRTSRKSTAWQAFASVPHMDGRT
jgi:bifunctional pyridoxal-dependent enzyme with beta-cystathionase and maltose regulon repressor activities